MTESSTNDTQKMTEERLASKWFGVAIFVLDQKARVLVLKEKKNKEGTERNAGEYGVVCETRETNEGWLKNLRRGLYEELGIPEERLKDVFDFSNRAVWETGFVNGVWATVARVRCKNPDLLLELAEGSSEVEVIGWKTCKEFEEMKPMRNGVANILSKFKEDIFQK